ncbi:acyl-CoA thioesterase [Streptomyces sirii]|uniref:acyl-CoA thioesterase n=1 Tax=Streptomyces sirii TaxID=3127701 RepID=UPI003D35AC18
MTKLFTHRLRVRYSECDQQNVVFNGHYLFYYDVALTELWREVTGGYASMVEGEPTWSWRRRGSAIARGHATTN